jgi:hypothetical protein
MATKEDILEEIVEKYLVHKGYFVIDGGWLVDGGLSNVIPVSVSRALGAAPTPTTHAPTRW